MYQERVIREVEGQEKTDEADFYLILVTQGLLIKAGLLPRTLYFKLR